MTLNELFENTTTTSAGIAPVVKPMGLVSRMGGNLLPAKYGTTKDGIPQPSKPRKSRAK